MMMMMMMTSREASCYLYDCLLTRDYQLAPINRGSSSDNQTVVLGVDTLDKPAIIRVERMRNCGHQRFCCAHSFMHVIQFT
jgi:hypothetical protein